MLKVVRIPNPMMALPGFEFSGIAAYSTRSMTCIGGVTVVSDCGDPQLLADAHRYYDQLGLGPDELIQVQTPTTGDLYQAILEQTELRSRIADLGASGYSLEFFCTRDGIEEEFVAKLGLDWSRVASHPSYLSDRWNNKSRLRKIAKLHGLEGLFPEHRLIHDEQQLAQSVDEMLGLYGEVVIKPPAWASGMGMVFGRSQSVAREYQQRHGDTPVGTIVERSLGKDHLSMSIVKRFVDGHLIDQWVTEQECPVKDGSVAHEGSILGDMPRVTEADVAWMQQATDQLYRLILSEQPDLTGIVNFDCIRGRGQRFVLECNARLTFSTYIEEIRQAIMTTRKEKGVADSPVTCLVRAVRPREIRDFDFLSQALGAVLLADPTESGVIPIVLGCLPTSGYCYLVAVADSYQAAGEIMAEAKNKLEVGET